MNFVTTITNVDSSIFRKCENIDRWWKEKTNKDIIAEAIVMIYAISSIVENFTTSHSLLHLIGLTFITITATIYSALSLKLPEIFFKWFKVARIFYMLVILPILHPITWLSYAINYSVASVLSGIISSISFVAIFYFISLKKNKCPQNRALASLFSWFHSKARYFNWELLNILLMQIIGELNSQRLKR